MRNLPFVIWMLGFIFVMELKKWGPHYVVSTEPEGIIALIVWIGVGILVYERKENKERILVTDPKKPWGKPGLYF